jgi:hypothetical protein
MTVRRDQPIDLGAERARFLLSSPERAEPVLCRCAGLPPKNSSRAHGRNLAQARPLVYRDVAADRDEWTAHWRGAAGGVAVFSTGARLPGTGL